jgi:hypothetical protein
MRFFPKISYPLYASGTANAIQRSQKTQPVNIILCQEMAVNVIQTNHGVKLENVGRKSSESNSKLITSVSK